jgi:hypothetical protein
MVIPLDFRFHLLIRSFVVSRIWIILALERPSTGFPILSGWFGLLDRLPARFHLPW